MNLYHQILGVQYTFERGTSRSAQIIGTDVSDMKPSVLVVCRGVYPYSIGGVEIHVNRIANELSKSRRVAVLFEAEKSLNGEHSWQDVRVRKQVPPLLYFITAIFAAIRSRVKPNVIIAHTGYAPLFVGYILSKILNTPFIPVMHGSDIRTVGRSSWIKYIQKMVLVKSTRILCVSEEIKGILVEEYRIQRPTIRIVTNGFDKELLAYQYKKIDSNRPKLVFVGYLRWEKDPLLALKVINQLKEKKSNILLTLIGEGDLRKEMEAYIDKSGLKKHVRLIGRRPHNEVIRTMTESDIFILTSRHEGRPIALIEAMALAKPIVATNINGVRELIEHEQNGLLVPVNNADAMAKKIQDILRNQELAAALGKQARVSVSRMSWQHIATIYDNLIDEVLSE